MENGNPENKNNNQELKIKILDEQLKGSYSNAMQVSHTKNEFILDFFSAFRPEGILVSRIIMSPTHLKSMITALEQNVINYESKFGVIADGGGSEPILGFHPESQSR